MFYKGFLVAILILISPIFTKISKASNKSQIINNLNKVETLRFDFKQESNDIRENGVCFMKRPHFLKCLYKDKKEKELIINRKNLVIYHKKFNKTYFYPVSKSFFLEILNKDKFSNLIMNGEIIEGNEKIEIKYYMKDKGEIVFFFDKENFDILGWNIIDVIGNKTFFDIKNTQKNILLENKIFQIPEIN